MGKYNGFGIGPALAAAGVLALLTVGCAAGKKDARSAPPARVSASSSLEPMPMATEPAPEGVELQPNAPMRYVVKKGDTLWDIASLYLKDPWQWPELWYANPQVKNPHLIYPGDELSLVWVEGRPVLARGDGKLSPQVREVPLAEAIPTIPLQAIRAFLRGPRLLTQDQIKDAPYVLEFVDEHLLGSMPDRIFVRNLKGANYYTHAIVRLGEEYRDPDDGAVLGYEAVPIGEAEMRERGEPSEMQLMASFRETHIGDLVLPLDNEEFSANFYPRPPPAPVHGRIISVFDGVSSIGQYQIVALNRGSRHGLEPGHVLSIYQASRSVDDPYGPRKVKLPEHYAGALMVFKTTPRLSYGLVMSAKRAVHILDVVDKPRRAG